MGEKFFDTRNIILLKISEDDLNSFIVDLDIANDGNPYYPLDELASSIINALPEYVFAQYSDSKISTINIVQRLKEAALSIYKIKEYEIMKKFYIDKDKTVENIINNLPEYKRGEFGEILLHLLLRDFKGTIPLISKVYFKDSYSIPAHGFDAVHISPNEKILWLGESKFYKSARSGINELIKDLHNHFDKDFLNDQFIIIKKNLDNNSIPQRDKWINILSTSQKLKEQIKFINIPLLCTYEDDIYNKFSDLSDDNAVKYYETNITNLKQYFDNNNNHPLKQRLNIILFLFPVRNKLELVKILHEKLWHMQSL